MSTRKALKELRHQVKKLKASVAGVEKAIKLLSTSIAEAVRHKRRFSAATRAQMSVSQRARWAKIKRQGRGTRTKPPAA